MGGAIRRSHSKTCGGHLLSGGPAELLLHLVTVLKSDPLETTPPPPPQQRGVSSNELQMWGPAPPVSRLDVVFEGRLEAAATFVMVP